MMQLMAPVVEQYLAALTAKAWSDLAATLSADQFERVGPFQDIITAKERYVEFLDRVVSPLESYAVVCHRVTSSEHVDCAEVTESFVFEGVPMAFPEVLVFDLSEERLIRRVQVYMMRPGEEPPVAGAKA